MKCPECNFKITQKHYDAAYGWYECPKCEGCFTGDEIVEAEVASHSRGIGRGSDSRRSSVDRGVDSNTSKKVVAKAKKKKTEIDADAEALNEYEKKITEEIVVTKGATKHRDEISIGQVVQIMADEIETVYEEMGEHISRDNAADKALTLWRNLVIHDGISAREKSVELSLCKEHQ